MSPLNKKNGFIEEDRHKYNDVGTVESQRNEIMAQEFPEGPYGSSIIPDSLGKSTPWREDQRSVNNYSSENRELHAGLARDYPGEDDQLDADAAEE